MKTNQWYRRRLPTQFESKYSDKYVSSQKGSTLRWIRKMASLTREKSTVQPESVLIQVLRLAEVTQFLMKKFDHLSPTTPVPDLLHQSHTTPVCCLSSRRRGTGSRLERQTKQVMNDWPSSECWTQGTPKFILKKIKLSTLKYLNVLLTFENYM